jgi:hypothetical protein
MASKGEVEHGEKEAHIITFEILEPGGEGRQVVPPSGGEAPSA